MLNNKQKNYLRKISYQNDILKFNIGKNTITNTVLDTLDKALIAHELIKVSFLKSSSANKSEFILDLLSNLSCDLVEEKGSTIILFRSNPELKNKIILPN